MGAHLRYRAALPRPFRRLLGSAWVSNTGDGVRNAALPLVAVSLSTTTSAVTVVAAATTLPFVLLGVVAGTMADRRDRAALICRAHLFRAVIGAGIAGLLISDRMTLGLLVLLAFLLGCGEALADSAAPALVPDLVDDDDLERANGELETGELVANDLVGPPAGSLLYAAAPAAPFVVDAVSFTAAAALVGGIDDPGEGQEPESTWRADLREGVTTAWTNPALRWTGALVALLQLGNVAAIAPIVVYMTERLGLDPAAYGLFLAVGSLGGIAGSRAARPLVTKLGSFRTLVLTLVVAIAAFLLMVIPSIPVVSFGFALSFGAVVIGRIVIVTARQRAVPSRLLGRAQGAMRTLLWGAATLGALIGGAVADALGDQAPFLVAAGCYTVGAVIGVLTLRPILEREADADAEDNAAAGGGSTF